MEKIPKSKEPVLEEISYYDAIQILAELNNRFPSTYRICANFLRYKLRKCETLGE